MKVVTELIKNTVRNDNRTQRIEFSDHKQTTKKHS